MKLLNLDRFNPCKEESGELGGKIHDKTLDIHRSVKMGLMGKIRCQCCRALNYRILKYGIVILLAALIPYSVVLGAGMITIALAARTVEKINRHET